ncbi:TetR family transcriptional regulator [Pilimelia columellifera]|uniref:TetR family transcriptional regulator n=1 Tax=Pilimelia columellifera subsp. columellifera TaxID=706583 RepID=A0ABN3N990_9ACTN
MRRRTGRRSGSPDTRGAILTAARTAFAGRGYDRASIRGIAAEAGVDPALVHHYFGTKDQLFLATLDLPINPAELIPAAVAGGIDGAGRRLVALALSVWDSPAGAAGAALLRSAMSSEWSARLLREFLVTQVLRRVFAQLGITDDPQSELRAALVASQLAGLVMTRYLLRFEPLASADPSVIAAAVGPTIQRYLTDDLDVPAPAAD